MKARRLELVAAVVLLAIVTYRAWICDDAAITARCVDNLLSGHGLRWNVDERVAPFTHPLWALLQVVPTAVVGWYAALVGLGIACTGVTLWLVLVRAPAPRSSRLVVAAILGTSMAFLDFSTSGLENALTHALLAGFVLALPRSQGRTRLWLPLLLAALLALNRLDAALLVAPAVLGLLMQERREGIGKLLRTGVVATTPLWAWMLFSLAYYGFALPNTAYAKLSTAIPVAARLGMGWDYLLFTLTYDPTTLLGQFVLVVLLLRRNRRWDRIIAVGAVAYDLYVLWIGGDFMGGRFWVAPLVLVAAGVVADAQAPRFGRNRWIGALVAVGVVAGAGQWFRSAREVDYGAVVDERRSFVLFTALRRVGREQFLRHPWQERGRQWRELGPPRRGLYHGHALGFLGLEAGPEIHIVDRLGLTDPFLARLPAAWEVEGWRPGHFERMGLWSHSVRLDRPCPREFETCRFWREYDRTLRLGKCLLDDAPLCTYWRELRLITRGDLWTAERWRAIAAHNLGLRSHLVDVERYQMAAHRDLQAGRYGKP